MNSYILDSLNYYNKLPQINNDDYIINNNEEFHNLMPVIYIKKSDKFIKKVYNIIGIFDIEKENFHWAWATTLNKHLYIKTNQLILHGINIETKTLQDIYLKKILTSSIIHIDNISQLEIIKAIACYLTKNNGIFTIFSENQKEKSQYITYYGYYDI